MDTNLINVDYFKRSYYKAFLPLEEINKLLASFETREVEMVTQTLISLFDVAITKVILKNLDTLEDQQNFLRLIQENYSDSAIMDFLIDEFPGSERLIIETLERTLLSAKKVII